MTSPKSVYAARLAERTEQLAGLERRHRWLGPARLVCFLLILGIAWLATSRPSVPGWLVFGPVAAFVVLVVVHLRARRAMARVQRGMAFLSRGMARIDGQWAGSGQSGVPWEEPGHPFAADLDLFGVGSLFELLCEARTIAGERTLAQWLQHPADGATVRSRHAAVVELAPRVEFRESLAVLGQEVRNSFDERVLVRWAETDTPVFPTHTIWICRIAVTLLLIAVSGALAGWWTATPVLFGVMAVAAVGATYRRRTKTAIDGVGAASRELEDLAELVARLEAEPVQGEYLTGLRQRLTAGARPASVHIWRLRRLIGLLDSRGNQLVMLVLPLLLWTTQLAVAISRWRRDVGPAIGGWISAVGEYEALASVSGYAFEHPEAVLPEFSIGAGFRAQGLGHPLLHGGGVRNDVDLGGERKLMVVSGSNMSGKSTLLRSVGSAVVMAQMGAPVVATSLTLEPLALGASISTHDSLQEGSSRFYAEITRLRQILDLAEGTPRLLYLLDELLSGTNSHDRRLGAEAVVRRLAGLGAIGILTTHDLALSRIATDMEPQAVNVHFRDHLEGERIAFDYRMHPGIVERGNALALMRSIGLEV
ncbi:MAG: DNA mismatch repair protein MutS [Gemmatimonadota bacterium]|nr:DNA mismatch repair protein MutS [Gemmatimonadota bacterium]